MVYMVRISELGRHMHGRTVVKRFFIGSAVVSSFAVACAAWAQNMPAEYERVLATLGRQGDCEANVLKVNIPRNDLTVRVANVNAPTSLRFGGWVAVTTGIGMAVLMGDLVKVNPVMSAHLDDGLDVTALHNHSSGTSPASSSCMCTVTARPRISHAD